MALVRIPFWMPSPYYQHQPGGLNRKLNSDFGGVADVLSRGHAGNIILGANLEVAGYEPLRYVLEIEPQGQS